MVVLIIAHLSQRYTLVRHRSSRLAGSSAMLSLLLWRQRVANGSRTPTTGQRRARTWRRNDQSSSSHPVLISFAGADLGHLVRGWRAIGACEERLNRCRMLQERVQQVTGARQVNWSCLGGCQTHGPFLGTLNTRCRIIIMSQKGALILTTTRLPGSS